MSQDTSNALAMALENKDYLHLAARMHGALCLVSSEEAGGTLSSDESDAEEV